MEEIQREGYRRGFHELGPSIIRALEVNYKGYHTLKNCTEPMLKKRAEEHRQSCRFSMAILPAAIKYAPNEKIRQKIKQMQKTFTEEFGLSSKIKWASKYVSTKLALKNLKEQFIPAKIPQPSMVKKTYRMSLNELVSREITGLKDNTLSITVQEMKKEHAGLVICKGHLDTLIVKKINKTLIPFLEKNNKSLILDFAQISNIDQSAVKILLNELEKYQKRIKFVFQKNHIDKIIQWLGDSFSFEMFSCMDEVVESFA